MLYESDHTCCLCHGEKGSEVQLHHISGRFQSTYDNLVVLCIACHSRVQSRGGFGKGYTPRELKRYKTSWVKEIWRRRKANVLLDKEFATVVELEVRKLSYAFQSLRMDLENEARALEILNTIRLYGRDFGDRVKEECVSAVYEASYWIQCEVVTDTLVDSQTGIVLEVLPIGLGGLRHPRRKAFTKTEKELFSHAINIAGEIAYAVCKYVRQKEVLRPAANLLYSILRFTDLNDLAEHKKQTLHEFAECLRIAETSVRRGTFSEGVELLRERRALALDRSYD
jgi:hypothetical protein